MMRDHGGRQVGWRKELRIEPQPQKCLRDHERRVTLGNKQNNNPGREVGGKQERMVSWKPEQRGRQMFPGGGSTQRCQILPRST